MAFDLDEYEDEAGVSFAERADDVLMKRPDNNARNQNQPWQKVGEAAPGGNALDPAGANVTDDKEGKPRAPRPKLEFQRLKRENGIPDIFKTFRQSFKQQAKGKGHEVGDLGRLLAMYERWHVRVFPHCDFDQFVHKIDRLYGKPGGKGHKGANLKGEVRELREGVVQLAMDLVNQHRPKEDDLDEDAVMPGDGNLDQNVASMSADESAPARSHAASHQRPPQDARFGLDENDELAALQKAGRDNWDDDELDDMMMDADDFAQQHAKQGASAHDNSQTRPGTSAALDDWDNDEFDDMIVDVGVAAHGTASGDAIVPVDNNEPQHSQMTAQNGSAIAAGESDHGQVPRNVWPTEDAGGQDSRAGDVERNTTCQPECAVVGQDAAEASPDAMINCSATESQPSQLCLQLDTMPGDLSSQPLGLGSMPADLAEKQHHEG